MVVKVIFPLCSIADVCTCVCLPVSGGQYRSPQRCCGTRWDRWGTATGVCAPADCTPVCTPVCSADAHTHTGSAPGPPGILTAVRHPHGLPKNNTHTGVKAHTHKHRQFNGELCLKYRGSPVNHSIWLAPTRITLPGVIKQNRKGINMCWLTTKLLDIYDHTECMLQKKALFIIFFLTQCHNHILIC